MSVCAVLVVFLITWPSIQFKHSSKVRNTHNSSLITHHSSMFFSPSELQRYDRHFKLPQFGMEAQQRLKAARVLVIGAGGLGSPLLQYLAAAGVGVIGIVDGDVVDRSNLQRQVLFDEHDIGRAKTDAAAERLQALNPHVQIQLHPVFLRSDNALDIIGQYDVVADGSDNFPTRYLVNDACVLAGKPLVYGAVSQFEGLIWAEKTLATISKKCRDVMSDLVHKSRVRRDFRLTRANLISMNVPSQLVRPIIMPSRKRRGMHCALNKTGAEVNDFNS